VVRILELRTDNHPDSLGHARRQVRDAVTEAGLSLDAARNLEIAVGEILANTCQHAYAGRAGPVSVEILSGPGALTVVVTDEGQATTAPAVPPMLPSGSSTGGRGLYLVRRLVDEIEIHINPAGHGVTVRMTVRMTKGVQSTAAGPSGGHGVIDELPAALSVEEAPPATDQASEKETDGPGTPKDGHSDDLT
jgi:serine/threonine-protein kinase RsbW